MNPVLLTILAIAAFAARLIWLRHHTHPQHAIETLDGWISRRHLDDDEIAWEREMREREPYNHESEGL